MIYVLLAIIVSQLATYLLLAYVFWKLREIKQRMATKEDLELLTGRVADLETEFNNIAADTEALKNEIAALNENAKVDLGPVIARLEGMAARAKAIVGPNVGSDPV